MILRSNFFIQILLKTNKYSFLYEKDKQLVFLKKINYKSGYTNIQLLNVKINIYSFIFSINIKSKMNPKFN